MRGRLASKWAHAGQSSSTTTGLLMILIRVRDNRISVDCIDKMEESEPMKGKNRT